MSFKEKAKTRKEQENEKQKKNWKMKADTSNILPTYFLDCWMIYCAIFYMLFCIVVSCYCNLLIKAVQGRVLNYIIVRDYKIRKDENRGKQKENPFTLIH